MADEIKKGGKKAGLGEIRTYSNQKWQKTLKGWELVKDIHRAKSGDGHQVHVHTVTQDKVHYHVYDKNGNKITNAKMLHGEFSQHYEPVVIHHATGGSPNQEHVSNYTKPAEEPFTPAVDPENEEDESGLHGTFEGDDDDDTDHENTRVKRPVIEDDDDDIDLDVEPPVEALEEIDDDDLVVPLPPKIQHRVVSPDTIGVGSEVRFITDGNKRNGTVQDIAPNGVMTVLSGSRTFYITAVRLI